MKFNVEKILTSEKCNLMSDFTFRVTFDLFQYINANDADSILDLLIILSGDGDEIKFKELDAINEKRNETITDSNEISVTRNEKNVTENVTRNGKRNALRNAERQKRYRERNGKRNDRNENSNEDRNEKESNKENILINNTLNNNNNYSNSSLNSIEIDEKNLKNNSDSCNEIEDKELINMPGNEKNVTRNEISVTKERYGSQKNVLLSQTEYAKLCEKLNDADQKIEAASLYFASKGNASKYKSHYATILNWERMAKERDAEKQTQQQTPKEKTFHDIAVERGLVPDIAPKTDFVDSFWRN